MVTTDDNKDTVKNMEMKNSDENYSNSTGTEIKGPDGGWGWVVTLGAFVITIFWILPASCFGILFSPFLLEEEAPAVLSFIIFNLAVFTGNLSGYLYHPIAEEFGWRVVGFVAGIVLGSGLILTTFAPSSLFLLFSFSVVVASSMQILHFVSMVIVQHYFTRWRAVVNAIVISGASVCDMIMPPLITLIQETYGYRAATLIVGALAFHCCAAAMVFHPVEWHYKDSNTTSSTKSKPREAGTLKRIFTTALNSLKVLKIPSDAIVAIIGVISFIITANFMSFIPFALYEEGYTAWEASFCLMIIGVTNFITKILSGLFSYCQHIKFRFVVAIGELMCGVSVIGFSLSTTFIGKAVALAVFGSGTGLSMSLYSLLIVEVLGLPKLASTFSVKSFLMGIVALFLGPILGAVHYGGNNYRAVFYFAGASFIVAFILCFILPFVSKAEQQKGTSQLNEKTPLR